jgi:predicted nucleic acid-binding Zn ribbon protein
LKASPTNPLLSSNCEHWNTPPEILAVVCQLAPIGLDPCSNAGSMVGAATEYRLDRGENGLLLPWAGMGLVFVNPPYGGALRSWSTRMADEARAGVEVIALVPARTDTRWWSTLAKANPLYCYLRGRVCFYKDSQPGDGATFPSALLYFGIARKKAISLFSPLGEIQERIVTVNRTHYCDICQLPITISRSTRRTCSDRCRKTLQRKGVQVQTI